MSGAMLFGGIFLGLAVLVNFMFIVHKFKHGRHVDAFTDIAVIMLASSLYGASVMGGVIATIGSMFISIYLHFVPLDLFKGINKPIVGFKSADTASAETQPLHTKWASRFDSLFE